MCTYYLFRIGTLFQVLKCLKGHLKEIGLNILFTILTSSTRNAFAKENTSLRSHVLSFVIEMLSLADQVWIILLIMTAELVAR